MGPIIRIILRYGVGAVIGYEVGAHLATDPDVVELATIGATAIVGAVTELCYWLARKLGWRT